MARKIMKGKRVNFDDDVVIVYENGKMVYKGLQDYNPFRDDNWKWNEKEKHYTMEDGNYKYIEVCLDI